MSQNQEVFNIVRYVKQLNIVAKDARSNIGTCTKYSAREQIPWKAKDMCVIIVVRLVLRVDARQKTTNVAVHAKQFTIAAKYAKNSTGKTTKFFAALSRHYQTTKLTVLQEAILAMLLLGYRQSWSVSLVKSVW